jgi:hypothetical protein
MTDEHRYEKYEKEEKSREQEEKTEEKTEEKHQEKIQEKNWEEKWRRDPLGAIAWAMILIWAGVAFLLDNLGLFEDMPFVGKIGAWSLVFAGAGVILLVTVIIRLIMPEHRRSIVGNIILGVILLGIGLGDVIGWGMIWAILIIAVGAGLLVGGLIRRR